MELPAVLNQDYRDHAWWLTNILFLIVFSAFAMLALSGFYHPYGEIRPGTDCFDFPEDRFLSYYGKAGTLAIFLIIPVWHISRMLKGPGDYSQKKSLFGGVLTGVLVLVYALAFPAVLIGLNYLTDQFFNNSTDEARHIAFMGSVWGSIAFVVFLLLVFGARSAVARLPELDEAARHVTGPVISLFRIAAIASLVLIALEQTPSIGTSATYSWVLWGAASALILLSGVVILLGTMTGRLRLRSWVLPFLMLWLAHIGGAAMLAVHACGKILTN